MAVTQKSDGDSKKTVEEGAESSCREGTDAGPCELIQLRKSDGLSTGPSDIKRDAFGIVKSYNPRRNRNKDNKSGSLFDIDDAETKSIKIYAHNQTELKATYLLSPGNIEELREKDDTDLTFTDIDVSGYLNTKEEIHLKRILWEAMNGKCTKAKKQKRATETKKGVSAKKAAKTTEKLEFEVAQKRSSRINYDALELLNDELN